MVKRLVGELGAIGLQQKHLKIGWLEDEFPFKEGLFSGAFAVSFRVGRCYFLFCFEGGWG